MEGKENNKKETNLIIVLFFYAKFTGTLCFNYRKTSIVNEQNIEYIYHCVSFYPVLEIAGDLECRDV